MPTQKPTELVPVPPKEPTKEQRLAAAIAALDPREKSAYKYFLQAKQEVSEELSDELFTLYLQGADCEEIRRQRKNIGLSVIVACRVVYEWDARRDRYRADLIVRVPERALQVHAEQVDFMADLLTATQVHTRNKVREYLVTKDEKLLEDLPIPKNMREYSALFELFIRGTGQDKKRVEFSGKVTHDHRTGVATAVTSDEAAGIIDELNEDRAIDVEVVPRPQVQPQMVRTNEAAPRTPEEMIAFLARTGLPEDKARALVDSIGRDVDNLSQRYAEIWAELVQDKKGGVN